MTGHGVMGAETLQWWQQLYTVERFHFFYFFAKFDVIISLSSISMAKRARNTNILTKIENILTHWSVAQTGLNDDKTEGRKSRFGLSH